MSKKIIGFSLVVLLAAGAFAMYSLSKKTDELKSSEKTDTAKESVPEITQKSMSGQDSLVALMQRGENLECTIKYNSNGTSTESVEGTYFKSRGRIRGDFVASNSGVNSVSSIIMSEGTLYSWTEIEGEKYGMKVSMDTLEESKASNDKLEAKEVVSLDTPVTYDCKEWKNLDGSIFEPPTDVIFKDFADIKKTGMEFGTSYEEVGGGSNKCGVCNQLSGSEKTQCLAALSC